MLYIIEKSVVTTVDRRRSYVSERRRKTKRIPVLRDAKYSILYSQSEDWRTKRERCSLLFLNTGAAKEYERRRSREDMRAQVHLQDRKATVCLDSMRFQDVHRET